MSESLIVNKVEIIKPTDTAKKVSETYTIDVNVSYSDNQKGTTVFVKVEE